VKQVVAIDTSNSMLNLAIKKNHAPNIIYQNCDVRELPFFSETFDKVTARMVFHHILEGSDRAISECNRILRKKGMLLLSEGVPPDEKVKLRYEEIFSYKEKRVTFMPKDIITIMKLGFTNITLKSCWLRNMSVRSWLEDSCVNENLETILKLHKEGDNHFKEVYNLRITSDDVYLDWKFIIATGIKKVKFTVAS
jgi:ubiquinone/menaquinone biosynthesis C-methylase UbiE